MKDDKLDVASKGTAYSENSARGKVKRGKIESSQDHRIKPVSVDALLP